MLEKHDNLLQNYASIKGSTRMQTRDGTEDYIDYAVSSYDRDFVLSLTEMDRRRLQLVEEALRRVDSGDYGRCLQCGVDVPEPRLQVEPWARYCIACQELDEQGLLQPPGFEPDEPEDEPVPAASATDEAEEELEDAEEDVVEEDDDDEAESDDEDSEEDIDL